MIKCEICGSETHVIKRHLEQEHQGVSYEEYQERYPDAPLLSETAKKKFDEMTARRKEEHAMALASGYVPLKVGKQAFHEVFDIPEDTKGVKSSRGGKPIPISVYEGSPLGFEDFVPVKDPNYIFNVDTLKLLIMGLESNIVTYLVGHAGTGKSTLVEQACAYTNRAMLRIQHTVHTEESHILGQYIFKNNETVWEPGPLQIAMKHGLTYCADEYDRGLPQVLSVYQPVLEGKQLVTKEAPTEWRVIRPHPDFRFVATGNTNGAGDDTGLYQSTALQDFANFERFNLMMKVDWMPPEQEIAVVAAQAGILKNDAKDLVRFAGEIRKEVDGNGLQSPVSPRALIAAAKIGQRIGSFSKGVEFAYLNRLNSVDREVGAQIAQRVLKS